MLVFIADEQQLRTLIFWTMGGFGAVTWVAILPALLVLAITIPTLLPAAHLLDALALGEREAGHVGVDVERLKRRLVAQVALAVGAGVAISGTVGFVGLIAPHIVRLLLGPAHRTLLPAAALFGGAFLVLADALARTIVSPAELPIGVLTALVGDRSFSGCWPAAPRARGCEPASGSVDRRAGRRQGADRGHVARAGAGRIPGRDRTQRRGQEHAVGRAGR